MVYSHSPAVFCPGCAAAPGCVPVDGFVCGLRRSGSWVCVYCGGPSVPIAGLVRCVLHSVRVSFGRLVFEFRLGALSECAFVRWLG